MAGTHTGNSQPSIDREEHRSVNSVNAKAVIPYVLSGNNANPVPMSLGLVGEAFDYVGFSSVDANGNYQTATFKSGGAAGTTVASLALTFDANSQITSITRT